MIKELKLTGRKKLLGAVIICALTITGLTMWYARPVAEAAILEPYHEGLVGSWRFDEGAGSVAKDSSGFGNDAAIYGASWVDGRYGKGLQFDGVDDYVNCGNDTSLSITDAITITAWIYSTPPHKNNLGVVVGKRIGANGYWLFVDSNEKVCFAINNDWTSDTKIASNNAVSGWTFVAGKYDGSKLYVCVNGTEKSYSTTQTSINPTAYKLAIGCERSGSAYYQFNGLIDEVNIYNRALSQAEIQEIFQKTPDFSSKLLAKIPKGATQVIVTASWQGMGNLSATIESPSEIYTEDMVPVYQKARYSTSGGTSEMLNIKRLSISIPALSSDENWYITLDLDDVEEYTMTIEIQK